MPPERQHSDASQALAQVVDQHIEYLSGDRAAPPSLARLGERERLEAARLIELLEVNWGSGVAAPGAPPLAEDPVLDALLERRHLARVVGSLGSFELFGVSRGRGPRTHSLDQSYVSLAVARSGRGGGADEDELTGAGVDVANAFVDQRRVIIWGPAGAGKTTLLRWLAVNAAGGALGEAAAQWGGVVPFFLPLRQFTRRDFPEPDQLASTMAGDLTGELPGGWAASRLAAGRALLLVDGVDELAPARRRVAEAWLKRLVATYPDARYVVTTRPFAVGADWLADAGFAAFDLQPLSASGIRDFLASWHRAARHEHRLDPELSRWIDECERGLAELLSTRHELRRLAGSPLLCGLLCALYQDRNMHLPRDRKSLYDAALDLLLVGWDEQRGIRVDQGPPLSKEEQIVLLQRFAYSLVKNHELLLPREEVTRRLAHAMRGLRAHDRDPAQVLQRTLERTGLLREPYPDEVQFVHRTFRDYLAAKEIVDSGDLNHLVDHAHLDHWHDVVVMAVAHARPRERDKLLHELLQGNAEAHRDKRVRDRLHLVAAACLEQADVVDTDEIRELVQRAAARLIPPATLDDAELLARAGAFVLDLLPGPEGLSEAQAARVVRTAAMVGGEGARDKISQFVSVDESVVIDELLRAWRRSDDPEDYARVVLAQVDFGDRRLEVRGGHRAHCLKYLTRLTSVACYGDFLALGPVAAAPNLRRLDLIQNELLRDLSPLAASRTLRVLQLSGCQLVHDLSPLARTTVEELGLYMMRADLRTLRGAGLRSLSIRDPALEDGLEPLPADLPLRALAVQNLPRGRSLLGIERWQGLEQVAIRGVPRPEEVDALARLPRLRHLVLHGPEGAEGLARLDALPALRWLDLDEVPDRDRDSMLAALANLAGVEVRVNDRAVGALRR